MGLNHNCSVKRQYKAPRTVIEGFSKKKECEPGKCDPEAGSFIDQCTQCNKTFTRTNRAIIHYEQ